VLVSTVTSFTFELIRIVGKLADDAARVMPWP
jgi:hypothetical protein